MINKIYNEDCIDTLSRMSDNYLNLTITSPPYNVDLGNNKYNKKGYDLYRDNKDHADYIEWIYSIFSLIYEKTVATGRCVINIGDGKNGKIPTHADIINIMSEIGWLPYFNIIWNKNNTSNRAAFGSYMSPSCPSFPRPFEFVLGFCKGDYKLNYKGITDLTREEFIEYSYGLWTFPGNKKREHPSAFPEELPYRLIKMLSYVDDIVYDPFSGIGTTILAAIKTNRRYIGSEISENYFNISQNKISEIVINP